MIEPEIAFADLEDDMDLIEDCLRFAINYVLENCEEEMAFFDKMIAPGTLERLHAIVNSHFKRMTYTEAIDILLKAQKMVINLNMIKSSGVWIYKVNMNVI